MSEPVVALIAFTACGALASTTLLWIRSELRTSRLARNLQHCSEALCQMVEIQMTEHQQIARNFGDIEERLLSLVTTEGDSTRPVDRRHQVLTMSRNGFPLDEIVRRLNIPKGEAELILNLRKYIGASGSKTDESSGDPRKYAQA
jgi:hypothetical protein